MYGEEKGGVMMAWEECYTRVGNKEAGRRSGMRRKVKIMKAWEECYTRVVNNKAGRIRGMQRKVKKYNKTDKYNTKLIAFQDMSQIFSILFLSSLTHLKCT